MIRGAFAKSELGLAALGASLIQAGFLVLLVVAGESDALVERAREEEPEVIPIEVQPVLDELPLLKLGSKKDKLKPKLPDMWQKREPVPVRRLEERSAPSADAKDDPEEIPESELADSKHEAPTEEDEVVKEADEQLTDEEPPEDAPELNEEGAPDGTREGTETDPLKARAVDLYRQKILAWFNARFRPPADQLPCEVLKDLSAGVAVQVGGSRNVSGFSITSPSGNPVFDRKVHSTLSSLVGQQLPPPPPMYPDILESTVYPRLSGRGACP